MYARGPTHEARQKSIEGGVLQLARQVVACAAAAVFGERSKGSEVDPRSLHRHKLHYSVSLLLYSEPSQLEKDIE